MSEEESLEKKLPKAKDVLGTLKSGGAVAEVQRESENDFKTRFERKSTAGSLEYEHLVGLRDHYRHKRGWSFFLGALLILMIGFQSVLLGMVGAGKWNFEAYDWLLPALLVQNLGQVIGLAIIVVRSLFKDQSDSQ